MGGCPVVASWQGGLAIAIAWGVQRRWTSLSPRVVCWVWRLACLKLLIALVWNQPVALALLPAQMPEAPLPVPRFEPIESFDWQAQAAAPDVARPPAPPAPQQIPLSAAAVLLSLWLIGVGYCALRGWWQWSAARRLVNAARCHSDSRLAHLCAEEAARLGVRRLPGLQYSSRVGSPILVGVWRPTIVVPERTEETFDEPELRMMLAHELAHRARHDLAWNWLPTVAAWLFFFHPLVWLLQRRWSEAQEAACDEMIIQGRMAQPAAYGRLLLKLSSLAACETQPGFTTAGVLGAYRNLERRVLAIARVKPFAHKRMAVAASLLLLTGIVAIVPWRLVAQEASLANGAGVPDLQAIQGTWECVESIEKGKAYKATAIMWVFEDDKVTILLEGKKQHAGTVKLNTSVNPPTIEMKLKGETAANLDTDQFGIYKLENDKLTLCMGIESAKNKTPKTFVYSKDFPTSSVVLQRKVEAEKQTPQEPPANAPGDDVPENKAVGRLKELGANIGPTGTNVVPTSITIDFGWHGTAADLKLLEDVPSLRAVLRFGRCGGAGAEIEKNVAEKKANPKLLNLKLQDVDAAAIGTLQLPQRLEMLGLFHLSDAKLAKISSVPKCREIMISEPALSAAGWKRLTSMLSGVEKFYISGPLRQPAATRASGSARRRAGRNCSTCDTDGSRAVQSQHFRCGHRPLGSLS